MDTQHRYPQLVIKGNNSDIVTVNDLPTLPRAHIIPAKAKQSVFDAKVSSYFIPTIKAHQSYQKCIQASLLGHELVGRLHNTDSTLYDAYLMRDGDQISINVLKKIQQIVDWRKDRPWADTDGQYYAIRKFMDVQKALHDF